jgi:hypothetical protein
MVSLTLTSSDLTPSVVRILANTVNVGIKKNNTTQPIENGINLAEVETQSVNNPTYSIQGVSITGETGTLTYDHVLKLSALHFNGTNAPRLTLTYGKPTAVTLSHLKYVTGNLTPTSESIPVILESANFNFSAKDTASGYIPQGSLTFVETRTP